MIVAENAPELQALDVGDVIAPVIDTFKPDSHVPEIVNDEFSYEFVDGEVIVTVGPAVKRL